MKQILIISILALSINVFSQVKYIDLSISQTNIEDCVTGVETNFQTENVIVFPNPSKGLFTISLNNLNFSNNLRILIHNIEGREIYKEKLNVPDTKLEKQIDLTGFSSGTYFLNINSKNKYYRAEIIIK